MAENIIRIHRPELTPEERARQMKRIEEAAAELLIAAAIARKEKKTWQSVSSQSN